MSMTLKLSHITWDHEHGPYSWQLGEVSGRARFVTDTKFEITTWVQEEAPDAEWVNGRIFAERVGWLYVQTSRGGIWALDDTDLLPDRFDVEDLGFVGNPASDVEVWIGGVRQVTSLGEVDPTHLALRKVTNGDDPRFAYLCGPGAGIEIHTWMGGEKKTVRKVLMVALDNSETRVMLIERAWLLGPDGATIERIAP